MSTQATDKRASASPEEEYQGFRWKGQTVRTIGELGSAAAAIKTRVEGQRFMDAYFAVNPHAYANVGYVAGYYDSATAQRIYQLCGTAHPIFGTTNPSPEQAFDAGNRLARSRQEERK